MKIKHTKNNFKVDRGNGGFDINLYNGTPTALSNLGFPKDSYFMKLPIFDGIKKDHPAKTRMGSWGKDSGQCFANDIDKHLIHFDGEDKITVWYQLIFIKKGGCMQGIVGCTCGRDDMKMLRYTLLDKHSIEDKFDLTLAQKNGEVIKI
jgi:hypothetical protein